MAVRSVGDDPVLGVFARGRVGIDGVIHRVADRPNERKDAAGKRPRIRCWTRNKFRSMESTPKLGRVAWSAQMCNVAVSRRPRDLLSRSRLWRLAYGLCGLTGAVPGAPGVVMTPSPMSA